MPWAVQASMSTFTASPRQAATTRSAGSFAIDAGANPHAGGLHFLGAGFALWLCWQITNVVGYFAGNLVPASWSMEFAVPLCFIALIAPHFKNAPQIGAGLLAGIAVVALDGLPMRLNLIAAGVAGIVGGTAIELAKDRWIRR